MPKDPIKSPLTLEQVDFRRTLLLCVHTVLGIVGGIAFLTRIDLSHLRYWRRSAGVTVFIMAAPVLIPYVVSAVFSTRPSRPRLGGIGAFIGVLVSITATVALVFTKVIDLGSGDLIIPLVLILQTIWFVLAAAILLPAE